MLQSRKIKGERRQHREQRKKQQEQPLRSRIMGRSNLPGRIDQNPEKRRTPGGVQKHCPAVVARKNPMSADVVKRKRKSSEQRGNHADAIQRSEERRVGKERE